MKIYDENQFTKSKLDERERGNSLGLEETNVHSTSVEQGYNCILNLINYGLKELEKSEPDKYGELHLNKENISIGNIDNIKKYELEIDENFIYLNIRFMPRSEFTKADLLLANFDYSEARKKLNKRDGIRNAKINIKSSPSHSIEGGKLLGWKVTSLYIQIVLDE